MRSVAAALPVIEYPSSDGKPMAETPVHRDVMIDALQILKRRFADRSDVYVSGDMLMYYEEGNPRKSVAPDVFVVLGADRDEDRDFLHGTSARSIVRIMMWPRTARSEMTGTRASSVQVVHVEIDRTTPERGKQVILAVMPIHYGWTERAQSSATAFPEASRQRA